jgi:hypothetical protein
VDLAILQDQHARLRYPPWGGPHPPQEANQHARGIALPHVLAQLALAPYCFEEKTSGVLSTRTTSA